jgi:hypothetical protein
MLPHPRLNEILTLGRVLVIAASLVGIAACKEAPARGVPNTSPKIGTQTPTYASVGNQALTYASVGNQALTNMTEEFYTNGRWRSCSSCGAGNQDWGDDAMTYAL